MLECTYIRREVRQQCRCQTVPPCKKGLNKLDNRLVRVLLCCSATQAGYSEAAAHRGAWLLAAVELEGKVGKVVHDHSKGNNVGNTCARHDDTCVRHFVHC